MTTTVFEAIALIVLAIIIVCILPTACDAEYAHRQSIIDQHKSDLAEQTTYISPSDQLLIDWKQDQKPDQKQGD